MQTVSQQSIWARQALLVIGGSIIMSISAQLSIPLLPVPVTFQTMTLLLLAIFLGPQLACSAMVAYLLEGAAGLPVFADMSGGIHVLLGPTAGYLFACPLAAFAAGWIAHNAGFIRIVLAGIVSALLILTLGTLFLAHFVGLQSAFNVGFKPFILIEGIKVLAVAGGVILSTRHSKKSA